MAGHDAPRAQRRLLARADLLVALGLEVPHGPSAGAPFAGRTVVQVHAAEAGLRSGAVGPRVLGDGLAAALGWAADLRARGVRDGAWSAQVRAAHRAMTMPKVRPAPSADGARLSAAGLLAVLRGLPADTVLVHREGDSVLRDCRFPEWVLPVDGGVLAVPAWSPPADHVAVATGAGLAHPGRPVVALWSTGDPADAGAELATAARARLPLLVLAGRTPADGPAAPSPAGELRRLEQSLQVAWRSVRCGRPVVLPVALAQAADDR